MPRYELSEGTSNKFWEITLEGDSFTTAWGRIGTKGQTAQKAFESPAKAQAEYDKLVAEKVKKGYVLAGSSAPPHAPTSTPAVPTPAPAPPPQPVAVPSAPAPAPPPRPVEAPQAPAPAPTPPSTEPTFELSRELRARAVRELKALELAAPQPEPSGWFGSVLESLRVGKARTALKEGGRERGALAEPVEHLLRGAMDGLTTFVPEAEAALLAVGPLAYIDSATPRENSQRLVSALVRRWGLARAVEVFGVYVESGHRVEVHSHPHRKVWLTSGGAHRDLLRLRLDQDLRAHVLAAAPAEREAARARAEALRKAASLRVGSALNLLFVDPEWLRDDLLARVLAKTPWLFNEEILLAAPPDVLGPSLLTLQKVEHDLFVPHHHYLGGHGAPPLEPHLAALAERLGPAAPDVFASWTLGLLALQRTHDDHNSYQHTLDWLPFTGDLVELLACSTNHLATLEAAIAVIDTTASMKLGKKDDPTPRALEILMRSPQVALPLVRQAAHGKASGWAKDLLGRLTRAATPLAYEVAAAHEVPPILRTQKPLKAPPFWVPATLSPPRLHNDKALPPEAMDGLAVLLGKDAPELAEVKVFCTPPSLAAFAWDLFLAWLAAGAPAKDKWAFHALGHFGNDDSARRLTPLIRAWPGESAHARAVLGLEVLALIGTDVALMMLNGIAQKVKFKGLQDRARETMDQIAERRGLTSEELADRLVPDLDLDEDGSKVLDFGPRSFRVGFDETLSPFVMDATGARLKDLPKPNSKDDPTLSAEAVEVWKGTKKDAKALAAIQLLRLELAMAHARRWRAADFETLLVHHPLLVHVVRRVVWGVYEGRRLVDTFRVAEDRTFANVDDDTFALDPDATVGVVHRLDLDDALATRWAGVLSDYELAQPFPQLERQAYRLIAAEEGALELTRFVDRPVDTKRLLGLTSRGWRRGDAQDNGNIWWFTKPIGPGLDAVLRFESGLIVGALEYTDPTQTLGIVDFGPGEPNWSSVRANAIRLSALDPIIVSEVIRDLESLGTAEAT